jgi:hypothetical protein
MNESETEAELSSREINDCHGNRENQVTPRSELHLSQNKILLSKKPAEAKLQRQNEPDKNSATVAYDSRHANHTHWRKKGMFNAAIIADSTRLCSIRLSFSVQTLQTAVR